MRRQIVEIQYLRALAVLLVVFGHARQAGTIHVDAGMLGDWAYVGHAGVDIFFVISGFIIHLLYGERRPRPLRFLLHRANRIFPMYWLATGAAMLGAPLVLGWTFSDVVARIDIGTVLLWPTGQLPFLGVGWTLTHELYFYLCYLAFLALPKNVRWWAAAAWGVAGLLVAGVSSAGWSAGLPIAPTAPLVQLMLSPFNLFFFVGMGLVPLHGRLRTSLGRLLAWLATIAGLAGAVMFSARFGLNGLANHPLRVVALAPFSIGIVILLLQKSLRLPPVLAHFLARVGDWSYAIYLTHLHVVTTLAAVMSPFIRKLPGGTVMYFVTAGVSSVLAGAILHRWVEQPLLKQGKSFINKW